MIVITRGEGQRVHIGDALMLEVVAVRPDGVTLRLTERGEVVSECTRAWRSALGFDGVRVVVRQRRGRQASLGFLAPAGVEIRRETGRAGEERACK